MNNINIITFTKEYTLNQLLNLTPIINWPFEVTTDVESVLRKDAIKTANLANELNWYMADHQIAIQDNLIVVTLAVAQFNNDE